nr:CBL-interacting serine/threonine-protein kinase 9 isoform X2 [Ipomoea batatas]GME02933.1 CBL-interacting serine/threonine-protein kinase 9 isoform X2 [Ipomoea batatas]GME17253.1 CBL-interacting serine/threonine-protein kinase 9 isoform X2 [Ipomoea batatas]
MFGKIVEHSISFSFLYHDLLHQVLADKGYNGTSADVWSCGVILFVLMAGYLPFDEPNLTVLYRRIQKASFAFPSWFSSSSKKLIKRILDPNPVTFLSRNRLRWWCRLWICGRQRG